jgi:hypothetical protein
MEIHRVKQTHRSHHLRKGKQQPDDPAQYKRFLEAAREAGADETKEGADQAFKKVAAKAKSAKK